MNKISIRPLTSQDAPAFMTWAGDPVVTALLFWDAYQDEEAAREFLRTIAEPHEFFYAVCLDGVPVGAVTLDRGKGPRAAHRAELGYVVARAHWGKGVATEGARLALAAGFQKLGVRRIEALVDPDNAGSMRVLEKAGLKQEGLLHQYVMHRGRLRDRWVYAVTRSSE